MVVNEVARLEHAPATAAEAELDAHRAAGAVPVAADGRAVRVVDADAVDRDDGGGDLLVRCSARGKGGADGGETGAEMLRDGGAFLLLLRDKGAISSCRAVDTRAGSARTGDVRRAELSSSPSPSAGPASRALRAGVSSAGVFAAQNTASAIAEREEARRGESERTHGLAFSTRGRRPERPATRGAP